MSQSSTAYTVFKLAPGEYTGFNIDKDTTNQGFEIHGAGNTIIQGSASWDATVGNVVYVRDFTSVVFKNITFRNGAYGLYTRACESVTVTDCTFTHLGSSGLKHELTTTQSQQAAYWANRGQAGAERSDGGAMRIRSSSRVNIINCTVRETLRGYRIQDCSQGFVSNCRAYSTLESAFYCAAGTYTGASGCTHFVISNCVAQDIFHSGYLVIGGHSNTIQSCTGVNCASSAVNGWNTQDLRVLGCVFDKCNTLSFIGIGVDPGDSYGQLYMNGKEGLTDTNGYQVTCLNNSFLRCGQGAADDVYTFYFGDDQDLSLTSCRAVLDNNNSDAAEDIKNPESVPLVGTQYPAAAAGGGGLQGATVHRVMVTDAQGNASVSDITKTELDALDGVSSNIQTQLDSAPSTSSNTTFEENLTVKKTFYIQSSDDATFWMSKPGFQIFRQEHKGSYVKFRLGSTAQFYMFDDGRYNFTGTHPSPNK